MQQNCLTLTSINNFFILCEWLREDNPRLSIRFCENFPELLQNSDQKNEFSNFNIGSKKVSWDFDQLLRQKTRSASKEFSWAIQFLNKANFRLFLNWSLLIHIDIQENGAETIIYNVLENELGVEKKSVWCRKKSRTMIMPAQFKSLQIDFMSEMAVEKLILARFSASFETLNTPDFCDCFFSETIRRNASSFSWEMECDALSQLNDLNR